MERLYGGAVIIYLQALFSSLAGIVFLFFMLRYITQEDVGAYSGFGIITGVAAVCCSLGLPFAINQIVPKLLAEGKKEEIVYLTRNSIVIGISISAAASLIIYLLSPLISEHLFNSEYLQVIAFSAIEVPLLVLSGYTNAFIISLRKFRVFGITSILGIVIRYGLGAVMLIAGLGLNGILLSVIVGDMFTVFVQIVLIFSVLGVHGHRTSEEYSLMNITKSSSPLYANSIINFFQNQIERLVILFASNLSILGIYSVGVVSITPVKMIASSLRRVALVDFATLDEAVYNRSKRVSKFLFLSAVPVGFLTAALARPLIDILSGPDYHQAIIPFVIIAITGSITVWYEALGMSLAQAVGKSSRVLYSSLISIGAGMTVSLFLIPLIDVIGAALGRAVLLVLAFALLLVFARKSGKEILDKKVLMGTIFAASVAAIPVFILDHLFPVNYLLPIYLVLGIIVYLLMLRMILLVNRHDLEVIKMNSPKALSPIINMIGRIAIKSDN